jgi:hypothetical protein
MAYTIRKKGLVPCRSGSQKQLLPKAIGIQNAAFWGEDWLHVSLFFCFGLLSKGRFLLGFWGIGGFFTTGRNNFSSTLFCIIPFFVYNFAPP